MRQTPRPGRAARTLTVSQLEDRLTPTSLPPVGGTPTDLFAVGSGPGIAAEVHVYNADGSLRFTLAPFGEFAGGATVSTGDLTGDGVDDVTVGAGPGGGPHVVVFDGQTGAAVRSFFAYDPAFRGGVFVGLGDVTGDRLADVVTGAGAGGGPHVVVFDGQTGAPVHSFFAYAADFRGGVTVRAGDVDGDGFADVVTGAGAGGGPHVNVFSGTDLSVLQSYYAADPGDRAGVFVGVANLRGDARVEVVGSAAGRLTSRGYVEQNNLIAGFSPGAVPLPVAAVRFNGIIAILIGAAPGTGSTVQIVDGTSNTIVDGTSNTIVDGTSNTIVDGTSNTVLRRINNFPASFTGGASVG